MPSITPIDQTVQLARFTAAVQLVGGQRSAARALDCDERTIRKLVAGDRELHTGWLHDMAAALRLHEAACRMAARELDPLFHGNLTDAQQAETARPSRLPRGPSVKIKDPTVLCHACGQNVDAGHTDDCPNAMEPWPTIDAELADVDDVSLDA